MTAATAASSASELRGSARRASSAARARVSVSDRASPAPRARSSAWAPSDSVEFAARVVDEVLKLVAGQIRAVHIGYCGASRTRLTGECFQPSFMTNVPTSDFPR
jgi:hypothetical protein